MTITDKQIQRRSEYLGASDVARAITGDLHQVVAEKLWPETAPDLSDNDAVQLGNALEPVLLAYAATVLGNTVSRRNLERRIPGSPVLLHLDGVLLASSLEDAVTGEPVEAKTHGLLGPSTDEWGEPGTADVPLYTQVQVQLACRALGAERGHVAAWLRNGKAMYLLPHDETMSAKLVEYANRVWESYVVPRRLPELDFAGWADLNQSFRKLPRYQGRIVRADKQTAKLVRQWEALKASRNMLDKLSAACRAELLYRLEQCRADGLDLGDGACLFARESTVNYKAREAYTDTRLDVRVVPTERVLPLEESNGKAIVKQAN